jgi:hypothetical protein
MTKKTFAFVIYIFIITGCHPENRRDAAPDHPNRSKHNADIPEGAKYTIPAHKDADSGDYPASIYAHDSLRQHDTVNYSSSQRK